jgi:hypothetical protein
VVLLLERILPIVVLGHPVHQTTAAQSGVTVEQTQNIVLPMAGRSLIRVFGLHLRYIRHFWEEKLEPWG